MQPEGCTTNDFMFIQNSNKMKMFEQIFDILRQPGERIPRIAEWMQTHVWSEENFQRLDPENYMATGEKSVYEVEHLILTAAWGVYDELVALCQQGGAMMRAEARTTNEDDAPLAAVIFDGASLRELPLFLKFARETGFEVLHSGYGLAALPSDTEFFIEQRILGKRLAPSQLPRRKELAAAGITAFYYDAPIRAFELTSDKGNLLLWSHFPDGTYKDLSAKFASHFSEIVKLFETVWKNTVMQIPKGYEIVITSDHGYIFFGPGLDETYAADAAKELQQNRYRFFDNSELLPVGHPGIQVIDDERLAMLRGRIKNRPQGPSGNKAYRHGGLSLMEMLTPRLVVKRS